MSVSSIKRVHGGEAASSENKICQCDNCYCGGIVRVVGIGPGHEAEMTEKAINAIQKSDIIVGYNTYIALIKDRIADKEIVGNGMRQEVDRCQKAVDLAVEGHKVAVISSGDPGVYGMAGLVLELIQKIPEEKRRQELRQGLALLQRQMALEQAAARDVVNKHMLAQIEAWRADKGDVAVMARQNVLSAPASMDITAEIISRMDASDVTFAELPKVSIRTHADAPEEAAPAEKERTVPKTNKK